MSVGNTTKTVANPLGIALFVHGLVDSIRWTTADERPVIVNYEAFQFFENPLPRTKNIAELVVAEGKHS